MQTVAPGKRTPVPTHLGKLPYCTSLRFFLSIVADIKSLHLGTSEVGLMTEVCITR